MSREKLEKLEENLMKFVDDTVNGKLKDLATSHKAIEVLPEVAMVILKIEKFT